jgi:hypothetical protein
MKKDNNTPKGRVLRAAELVVPHGINIEIRGERVKSQGGSYFLAELVAGNRTLARSRHRDWRKAYKGLEIELCRLAQI